MLKLKHSLLLLLALFLAACGSQAELPSAVPSDQAAIGQISAADLEQALAEGNLTAQTYWNKKKFNKFILKKVVIGHGPKHQEYAVGVVCEAPYKHGKPYLKAAYLEGGESLHFYVPKHYTKCVAFEAKTYGDHVWFTFQNNQYKPQKSEVTFENEHLKASKVFHVKPGLAKFTVYNKYDPKPQPKPLDIYVKKFFKDHYGQDVHIGDQYHVTLTLVCGDVRQDLTFGSNALEDASGLLGKTCYIEEKFGDDKYHTVYIKGSYQNYKHYYKGSKGEFKGECEAGHEGYDYCKAGYIKVDKHSTKLVLVIVDIAKEKYQPKKLHVTFEKDFTLGYNGPEVHPTGYELKLQLFCGDDPNTRGELVAETNMPDDSIEVYADKVQGKHCELVEYFKDDQYKTVQYRASVDDGVSKSDFIYNDCEDYSCQFKRFKVGEHATKVYLEIDNNVKELLKISIKKHFLTSYDPKPIDDLKEYDLEIVLTCGGVEIAKTEELHYEDTVYADQVRGKHCELTEYFDDYEYEAKHYQVFYDDGKYPKETFNGCADNYCRYSRYDVSEYATKLDIKINNYLAKKEHHQPTS